MPYAKTSLRAEQRALREEMRGLGMSRRQVAVEFARRHELRPRAAWRHAHGWSLTEAAKQINVYAARTGLDADGVTVAMTAAHLCEHENWPGHAKEPSGRRPTPYFLSLLAAVYGCTVHDLLDVADYRHMPPADRLILDKTTPAGKRDLGEDAVSPVHGPPGRGEGLQSASTFAAQGDGSFGSGVAVVRPVAHEALDGAALAADADLRVGSYLLSARSDVAGYAMQAHWPWARLSRPMPSYGVDWHLELPPGRVFEGGGRVAVHVRPLMNATEGRAVLSTPDLHFEQFMTTRQRGMLVGVYEQNEGLQLRGLDLREARREIGQADSAPSAVAIPQACELDDLTYGLIWALVNFDDALLADDQALDERRRELRSYEQLPRSAVGLQTAADLTSVARMWLGSNFCASHIVRNLALPSGLPVFWTREQTGEEACTWLLFRHKHDYLKRLGSQFARSPDPLIRGFCIPEAAVMASARWERILLFLSVALMESLGIRVKICAEPEYADVDGFVLLPGERAIIATWVRADDIWHVATTARSAVLRDFSEVTGHVTAHSVTEAGAPARRLRELSGYLGLDWAWLWRRCAGLGEVGLARLVRPRSRLLSTAGVDAALRYAGAVGTAAASDGR
jgi:hypothetical protein